MGILFCSKHDYFTKRKIIMYEIRETRFYATKVVATQKMAYEHGLDIAYTLVPVKATLNGSSGRLYVNRSACF